MNPSQVLILILLFSYSLIHTVDSFHLNSKLLISKSKLKSLKMELQLKYLKIPIQDDTSKYEILLKV